MKRKILFGLFTTIFVFICFESVLRLLDFEFTYTASAGLSDWVRTSHKMAQNDRWFRNRMDLSENEPIIEYDPVRFWKFRGSHPGFNINDQGTRGTSISSIKRDHEFRILCMGDSCTWGYLLDHDKTYPSQLENLFTERCSRRVNIKVINAGVPGYSSFQGLKYLMEILDEVQPDLITIYFGRNDCRLMPSEWQGRQDKEHGFNEGIIDLIQQCFQKFKMYQWIGWGVFQVRKLNPTETENVIRDKVHNKEALLDDSRMRVTRQDFNKNIQRMVEYAQSENVPAILLTIPVNPSTVGNYNDQLRKTAMTIDSEILDIEEIFQAAGISSYLFDDCHPNPKGNRLIAREICNLIPDLMRVVNHPLNTDFSYGYLQRAGVLLNSNQRESGLKLISDAVAFIQRESELPKNEKQLEILASALYMKIKFFQNLINMDRIQNDTKQLKKILEILIEDYGRKELNERLKFLHENP